MKWTSEYSCYLRLSASIFLNRITPALLYTVALTVVTRFGTLDSLADYGLVCAIFYPCLMLANITSYGTRFYTAKHINNQSILNDFLSSSIWLSLILSLLSVAVFVACSLFFIDQFSNGLLLIFSLLIPAATLHSTLVAFNEGLKKTRINNISNGLAIPVLLVTAMILRHSLVRVNIIPIVAGALLIAQVSMLACLMQQWSVYRAQWITLCSTALRQLLSYSLPVGLLFVIRRFIVSSLLISSLHQLPSSLTAWQIAYHLALYWSFLGNALASTLLVNIMSDASQDNLRRNLSFLSVTLGIAAMVTILAMFCIGPSVITWIARDLQVITAVVNYLPQLTGFILSELLLACTIGFYRSQGDVWRPDLSWIGLLLVFYQLHSPIADYAPFLTLLTTVNFLVSALFIIAYWFKRPLLPRSRPRLLSRQPR